MIIQIYEIQTPGEAEQVISAGADHIGSVLLSTVPWKVPVLKETIQFVSRSGAKSSLIPLFSDVDFIQRAIDYYQPDIVHFCEMISDTPDSAAAVERLVGLQQHIREMYPEIAVMRTIPIPGSICDENRVWEFARRFEPVSDYFLTDTLLTGQCGQTAVPQPSEGFIGITGKTCNWNIAAGLVASVRIPVILAGGITPDNVADGIHQVRPAGVDSCTGTNAKDAMGRVIRFHKDIEKVSRLVRNARKADMMQQRHLLPV